MCREHHGLSQTDLGARAHVSQPTVVRMERGENAPSIALLRAACTAVGLQAGSGLDVADDVYAEMQRAATALMSPGHRGVSSDAWRGLAVWAAEIVLSRHAMLER